MGLQPGLDRILLGQPGRRVTPGFLFPCFFFNPARFQPRIGWVFGLFQNYSVYVHVFINVKNKRKTIKIHIIKFLQRVTVYKCIYKKQKKDNKNTYYKILT
jgi:hypothetical protein